MDINQLRYFITIVDSDCNLSLAARKIHITQSALSQFITNFEQQEELLLFKRKNGRLVKLTPAGKKLYEYALEITHTYDKMRAMVQREAAKQVGTIRIGIPINLIHIYFSKFLPTFITKYPNFEVEIFEDGAKVITQKLINGELDYAILVEPSQLDKNEFEEYFMKIESFQAYMNKNHPLALKDELDWAELTPYPVATLNNRFVSHDLIQTKLNKLAPKAQIKFTSLSWDYLLEICQHADIISLLPTTDHVFLNSKDFVSIPFRDPVHLVLLLCRPHKKHYQEAEILLHKEILDFFYQPKTN